MSILSWFRRKSTPPAPVVPEEMKVRFPRGVVPPVTTIGVASENSGDIASTLAFVIHETCGWNVVTISTQYFVGNGVTAMLGLKPGGGIDPVIGAQFEDVCASVREYLDAQYPGIWLRCLDNAVSRLPRHVFIVHGIAGEDQADWVRARGGFVVGDGTVPGLSIDEPVGLDSESTYIQAAGRILDAMTHKGA